jgi:PucR family transcriptional regulator, purine catabolism regulatory protein
MTVADALHLPAFARVRLVAGHGGIGRRVRAVNIMEVPDIGDFVKPDDLLFTTGYPFRENPGALGDLVELLVQHQVAGIAIKPNRYIGEIPAVMLEAADRLAFPVLQLPPDAIFAEFINPLLSEILNRQAVILRRSEEIYERFTRVILSGGRFPEITDGLADLTGDHVVLYDGDLPIQSSAALPPSELPRFSSLRAESSRNPTVAGLGRLLHTEAVQVGGEVFGHVTLWGVEEADEIDRRAVQHAAAVLGLELQRQERVRETKRRYTAQFVIDYLEGRLTDREELSARARVFALPLSQLTAHLAIQVEGFRVAGVADGKDLDSHLSLLGQLMDVMEEVCTREGIRHFLFEHQGLFHLLYAPPGLREAPRVSQHARYLAEQISEALHRRYNLGAALGVGRWYGDYGRLPDTYAESLSAVTAARQLGRSVVEFAELGVARLLVGKSRRELSGFIEDMLGPLLRYDAEKGTDLLGTLEGYLKSGCVIRDTAERMHLHYNTVRYRIERINDLLGRSLQHPEGRAGLYVAVQALRLRG